MYVQLEGLNACNRIALKPLGTDPASVRDEGPYYYSVEHYRGLVTVGDNTQIPMLVLYSSVIRHGNRLTFTKFQLQN